MKPWTNLLGIRAIPSGGFHIVHISKDKKRHLWNPVSKKWQQVQSDTENPAECCVPSHSQAYDFCKETSEPPA